MKVIQSEIALPARARRPSPLRPAHDLEDKEALGDDSLAGPFADKLARWLSLRYATVAVRSLDAEDPDPETRERRLSHLCADVTSLQREAHEAQRIALERERIQIQLSNVEWQRNKDLHQAETRALNVQSLHDALPPPPGELRTPHSPLRTPSAPPPSPLAPSRNPPIHQSINPPIPSPLGSRLENMTKYHQI